MDLKRFDKIVAAKFFSKDGSEPIFVGFHSDNLEVAEISEELFLKMNTVEADLNSFSLEPISFDSEPARELLEWNEELNPNLKSGKIDFGIRGIAINVNQICNLKCNYCAAGGDGTYGQPTKNISVAHTLPQLKMFLDSLKSGSKFSISFIGGEPLIHPEIIRDLVNFVVAYGKPKAITPNFSVVTNGTLLAGQTLDIVRSLPLNITVSIDGPSKINDLVRPSKDGKSTTEKILNGLENLSSERGSIVSLGLSAVMSTANHDLIETYKFLRDLNHDWIEFTFAYSERSSELNEAFISQLNEIARLAWEFGKESELRKIRTFDHYFKLLDAQQLIENHCGAGKSYLAIDSSNQLYACHWFIGKNAEVIGAKDLIDPKKTAEYSDSLVKLNSCEKCWAKNVCGGGCMYIHSEHTGDKHKKDDLFCKRTRSLLLTAIMYYKLSRNAE